jgi:hypothetical protein
MDQLDHRFLRMTFPANSLGHPSFVGIERILEMFDAAWRRRVPLHHHDIESARSIRQVALGKILRRQPHEFGLFFPIHSQHRATESLRRPGFHFDKDQHSAVFGHEIQLAQRGPEIARQDPIAFGL